MTRISFGRDGWLEGRLDDADEDATFTRLKITVGEAILTKAFSKRGGGESDALNLPLLPLAAFLARTWWPLLNEPLRAGEDRHFPARHRLDLPMHGYVFPALAICSAGEEAMLADWALAADEHAPIEFLTSAPKEPVQLGRTQVETTLMDLVEATLSRLPATSAASSSLREDWGRVIETMSRPGELAYCVAAGRLGLDPYDEDTPDLARFSSHLSEDLFNDITDASALPGLAETTDWTRDARAGLDHCPQVDIAALGEAPRDSLTQPAWAVGANAARAVRARLGLDPMKAKEAVGQLLADAVNSKAALARGGPSAMTALVHRTNGVARIGAVARSARQQRFRACAAVYIAWCSKPGEERAGTIALTRRQQASRSFAAEMLAPQQLLIERANGRGFTADDLEAQASRLISPYDTVLWQSVRAGIPLWDVDLPAPKRVALI
jgi:hypothetical protein